MAEAARKAGKVNAENSAVIRAGEVPFKAEADERAASEEAGAATCEAQNPAAKAKAAAAANEVARLHAAKDKVTELQAAKTKEEAVRHAREAETTK